MKMEAFTDALIHVMRVCQNYMHHPGYVENTVFLIEMNEMSMFNFPFKVFFNRKNLKKRKNLLGVAKNH